MENQNRLRPVDSSDALLVVDGQTPTAQKHDRASSGDQSSQIRSSGVGWKPVQAVRQRHGSVDGLSRPSSFLQEPTLSHPLDPSNASNGDPVFAVDDQKEQPPKRLVAAPHTFVCPVAPEVLRLVDAPYRQIDEFKYMYYTPVTCAPDQFSLPEQGYTLRQLSMGRRTELLIAITMYNESDEFLIRTLSGVFKNIRYLCEKNDLLRQAYNEQLAPPASRRLSTAGAADLRLSIGKTKDGHSFLKPSQTAGPSHLEAGIRGDQLWTRDGWQKIVVAIIADGRLKCHKRVLQMLQVMGVYQEDAVMTEAVDPMTTKVEDTQAHLFEYTCQITVDQDLNVKGGTRQGVVPVQMLFCLKEKNAKKLNSHKWLFRAFAPLLNPYVCVLIDVGTRPKTEDAIYHLWKAFDRNMQVAGSCGEICVMLGKGCSKVKSTIHPLIASQNFEYKISNILDKTLESCFGYISVLPGAFSAYRWEALQDVDADEGPLISYFKGETPRPEGNVFSSNMYLAEDRILCFELVAKKKARWLLHYCSDAKAETDVPATVHELINQRRRWLNGTFFCQVYAIAHVSRFWKTNHGLFRKIALMFQYLYFAITLIFSWFAMANFYLSFYLLSLQTLGRDLVSNTAGGYIFDYLRLLYIAIIIAQFVCAMGNRPQGSQFIYATSMFLFALIMLFIMSITIRLIITTWPSNGMDWIVQGGTGRDVVLSTLSTFGVYLLSSLFFGELGHIVFCMLQYLMLMPSYINTLTIFAFCNTHDISWGTKGDTKVSTGDHTMSASKSQLKSEEKQKPENKVVQPVAISVSRLSAAYNEALRALQVKPVEEEKPIDLTTRREDYYRNVRTYLVLMWILSNGLLVTVISSPRIAETLTGSGAFNPYMSGLMYAMAAFNMFRLFGCLFYLVLKVIRGY